MSYIVSILLIHDNDDGGDAMDDLANLDIHLFPVTSYDSAPGHSLLPLVIVEQERAPQHRVALVRFRVHHAL